MLARQTAKRDFLIDLKTKYQKEWHDQNVPKWMGTFPYPYMNGSLHLGHAFTISKIEFNSGFQRMLGKRALFPMAFHCTGMPIKAAAEKLVREIELQNLAPVASHDAAADTVKQGKVAAKATDSNTFLRSLADFTAFGARIDWRRSFITTDVNPYYDTFVRWQMNKLHAPHKIRFGERHTIYSPKDGQPCMDHDRQEGEGAGPQEYTGIKTEEVKAKRVYMAATLRPETMYGQTNCFVGKDITYGSYAVKDDAVFLCTHRAIRNMVFQGVSSTGGEIKELAKIPGAALIGTQVHVPLSVNPEVWVLPTEGVLANRVCLRIGTWAKLNRALYGTGVVTSIPSDSPADAQTLFDLRRKPEFCGIDLAWAAFEPIPIISTPTYGDLTAPALLKALKIQSQKDTKQITGAGDIAYKEAIYGGTMLAGACKGMSAQDAKPKIRDEPIAGGEAFAYSEPEGWVMSRSGDECVVGLEDQWYLDYGETEWRAQDETDETRVPGDSCVVESMGCVRSFGLGSRLPWDPAFLVESLSDSTIYMSYYTVAHLLQGGVVDGSQTGPLGITPDQPTDEV
ncbi:cytosolic leucyl tRNA synthetase [Ceratobasidium sp. 370]|nr:cytosolic leucyl tRNA synthetase [Ceratobasidium sp. 370]